ncbi:MULTISPECIES: TetR/AcrR family transcriptional regulator C-terminal domain-containing protein [unclassified Blastococcus]
MAPEARRARAALSRERVLSAAVELADGIGAEALSMRRLGEALSVEAMSLYNHVANKDDLLDGMVDVVFGEIDLPAPGERWRAAMQRRAESMRAALTRHRWAIGLLESRTSPGAVTLRQHDAVLGCLRGAGFPVALAGHAFSAIDSYVYGFALQERSLPLESPEQTAELTRAMLARFPDGAYPHLAEFMVERTTERDYDFGDEFGFGLDLVLDGLERALADVPARAS